MMLRYWLVIGLFFPYISNVHSAEYSIVSDKVPTYLFRKFDVVEEEVFPNDITVKVSFTKIRGTLLYSIDKHMNQLIVKMIDNNPYTLSVELSGQIILLSLPTLCGCVWCRYDIMELRIHINHFFSIQCNGGKVRYFEKYSENQKTRNENYPIIYSSIKTKTMAQNEAHLWLINTPQYGDVYPNPLQMTGCIFHVKYKDNDVAFTNKTNIIGAKCSQSCTTTICNGGLCHETYGSVPICDCTEILMNGRYCNESLNKRNLQSVNEVYAFELLKLSWNTTVNEILVLKNEKNEFVVGREKTRLFISLLHHNIIMKVSISESYVSNAPYVIIIHFTPKTIDVKLLSNGSWTSIQIPVNTDLSKELFDSLTLRSGNGFMDLAQKSLQELFWSRIDIVNHVDITKDTMDGDVIENFTNNCRKSDLIIHRNVLFFVIAISTAIITIGAGFIISCHRKKANYIQIIEEMRKKEWIK